MKQKYQGSTNIKDLQGYKGDNFKPCEREFELVTIKEGEKVDSFLGRNMDMVTKMKSNGERVVSKTLLSLTEKFNYVVCAVE